jgi:hypothetical protein
VKRQLALLSVIFCGLMLLAPFPGTGGFRLMPWFEADTAALAYGQGIHRSIPEAYTEELPDIIDAGPVAAGGSNTSTVSCGIGSDPKLVSMASGVSVLSNQSCSQQLIHPCIQDHFVQYQLLESSTSRDGSTTSGIRNREPIIVSRSGNYDGPHGQAPRGLPSMNGYGSKREPSDLPTHAWLPDSGNPRSTSVGEPEPPSPELLPEGVCDNPDCGNPHNR